MALPCCWQALRSLALIDTWMAQEHIAAAATLTQLTRLALGTPFNNNDSYNISCLSALTGLQSLSLAWMELEAPGLSLVQQPDASAAVHCQAGAFIPGPMQLACPAGAAAR